MQSMRKMMASLISRSERDLSLTASSSPSLSSLTPPESTSVTGLFPRSHRSGIGSRVTPGVGSVIARLLPMSLLKSVDLPTFGLPIIEMSGSLVSISALFLISSFSIRTVEFLKGVLYFLGIWKREYMICK